MASSSPEARALLQSRGSRGTRRTPWHQPERRSALSFAQRTGPGGTSSRGQWPGHSARCTPFGSFRALGLPRRPNRSDGRRSDELSESLPSRFSMDANLRARASTSDRSTSFSSVSRPSSSHSRWFSETTSLSPRSLPATMPDSQRTPAQSANRKAKQPVPVLLTDDTGSLRQRSTAVEGLNGYAARKPR